ncbi:MAG: hypothetical protein AAF587_41985 [Bacteroidota bacterium]
MDQLTEEFTQKIKELLLQGQKLQAIQLLIEQTSMGLKMAKDFVDQLEKDLRT